MLTETRAVGRQNRRGHLQGHASKGQETDLGHGPSCSIRKHRNPLLVELSNHKLCRGCQQSPSVAYKRLTLYLSPLDATLTKNRGERSPQLVNISRRRPPPKHYSRKDVAHDYQGNHNCRHLQLVMHQVRQRVRAIPYRQIPDSEVPEQPRNRDGRRITEQRHFKHPCSNHENFEWRWRWQQRRYQHPHKAVLLHPVLNGVRVLPGLAVKQRFPALSRDEVQQHAT